MARKAAIAGVLSALFFGAACIGAYAQDWRALGPDGGMVNVVHGVPGGLYRTMAVANNGLFLSDDAGRRWREASPPVPAAGPIASDPAFPSRNFLFDISRRLLRSDNLGNTWAPTGHTVPDSDRITSIASYGSTVLYATYAGVFRSTDFGQTFAPVSGIPAGQGISVVAIDPLNVGRAIAGAAYADAANPVLYGSTDGGATWTPMLTSPQGTGAFSVVYVPGNIVVASIGDAIVASTDGGATWATHLQVSGARIVRMSHDGTELLATDGMNCFYSTNLFATQFLCNAGLPAPGSFRGFSSLTSVYDGFSQRHRALLNQNDVGVRLLDGLTDWTIANTNLHAEGVRGLAFAPNDSRRMLTGRFPGGSASGGVASTSNAGATWTYRLEERTTFLRSFAFDPTTGADIATTRIYAAGTSKVYLGRRSAGVFKSVDGGATWDALDSGLPTTTLPSGIVIVQLPSVRKVLLDPRSCANPPVAGPCVTGPLETVYAISDGGTALPGSNVLKSTQGGANWMAVGSTLPQPVEGAGWFESLSSVDLEIDPSNGALYLSTFVLAYNDDGTTRIPTIASGVFRSADAGATWTRAATGLPLYAGSATSTKDVFAIAVHPRRAGVLWAATIELGENGSRIYRSVDGGATWSAAGAALADCDVRDLQVDSAAPDVIYAAGIASVGQHGCIWRSENGGDDWTALHAGTPASLTVTHVYDVRQDPQDRRRLVAATSHGVWEANAPSDKIFTDTE